MQRRQIIQHATQGPNIGGSTVRLLLINLGTDKIGGPHLCLHVPALGHLGDVHISNLHAAMLIDQTIGRLQIPVYDPLGMQRREALQHVDSVDPNLTFVNVLFSVLMPLNLGVQVAIRTELHHNAQLLRLRLDKGLVPSHKARVLERCQDPNLIKGVPQILGWNCGNVDTFKGIDFAICLAFDLFCIYIACEVRESGFE